MAYVYSSSNVLFSKKQIGVYHQIHLPRQTALLPDRHFSMPSWPHPYLRNSHLLIYLCQADFSVSVCCCQCIRQIDAKPGNPVFQYHQLQIALRLASQAGIYGFAHSGVGTSIYVVLKTYSGYPWGLCTSYIFHTDGFQALCHLGICHCRNTTEPYCQYPLQTVFSLVLHLILQSLILHPYPLSLS